MNATITGITKVGFALPGSEVGARCLVKFSDGCVLGTSERRVLDYDFLNSQLQDLSRHRSNLFRPTDETWAQYVGRIYGESEDRAEAAKAESAEPVATD